VDDPGRAPGWTYTDPAILDGWGRASMMVPPMIAASHPDLATVERVLDVGAGVGLLAVSAAGVWPGATIVGIDPWEASLDRARANVAQAGLGDRITLRAEDLAAIDDEDEFDCVWIPSFFLSEADLEKGLPAAVRALRPGGWIALATSRGAPDAIGDAVAALRVIRGGGVVLDTTRALELLAAAGCEDAHVAPPPPGPAPLDLVLGRKPV
jgi:SAM-dependent methyltransferase